MVLPPNVVGSLNVGLSQVDDAGRLGPDVVPDSSQPTSQPQPDVQPETQPVRMVPQADLDALRSKLESRAARAENERTTYEQRAVQAERTAQVSQRTVELYQQYLAEGQAGPEVWAAAQYYATQDYAQETETQAVVTDATRYRQQQQQQARQDQLVALRDEVIAETGLTAQELQQATATLNPTTSRRFEADVWRAATAAALAKAQGSAMPQTPDAQARALRQAMPMPGGGTAAGGIQLGRPAGVSRRDPRTREWALQALAERERTQR